MAVLTHAFVEIGSRAMRGQIARDRATIFEL